MRSTAMLRIAFTMPDAVPDEAARIAMLLSDGWDAVHLRHPRFPIDDMAAILRAIPAEMLDRIVLHDHFSLAHNFAVGALHLNSRNPEPPAWYTGAVTSSCHSVEEVLDSKGRRYVTLSPVFDSISKPGYKAAFSPDQLAAICHAPVKVIALGGVNHENIKELSCYPFSGYAVMGALKWHDDIDTFKTSYRCFNS